MCVVQGSEFALGVLLTGNWLCPKVSALQNKKCVLLKMAGNMEILGVGMVVISATHAPHSSEFLPLPASSHLPGPVCSTDTFVEEKS